MPRVTEEYRAARRDEIARAALRCLERKGVRETSIADIVEESGLSTGAIYSNFSNKAELARYIVGRFLIPRIDALETAGREGSVVAPRDILAALIRILAEDGLPASLILQFWGEAMVDSEIHDEMIRTATRLRGALTTAVEPWARTVAADDADAVAARTTLAIVSLAQGYIANTAVFGPRDGDEYVDTAAAILSA